MRLHKKSVDSKERIHVDMPSRMCVTIFFTADHHFFHHNIIGFCERPFSSVEEMHHIMVMKWNNCVHDKDTVYYLGDFGLAPYEKISHIAHELRGNKILIKGNHDRLSVKTYKEKLGFLEVYDSLDLHGLWLSHYPYHTLGEKSKRVSKKQIRRDASCDDWLLCGHHHRAWRVKDRQLNVGVDVNDFFPLSIEEVREEIYKAEEEYEG